MYFILYLCKQIELHSNHRATDQYDVFVCLQLMKVTINYFPSEVLNVILFIYLQFIYLFSLFYLHSKMWSLYYLMLLFFFKSLVLTKAAFIWSKIH